MGYSERVCQLCGVSFNIGRIRKADEPEEAAWAHFGSSFCNHGDYNCEAPGCSHAPREVVGSTGGPSGRIEHRWTEEEHFAGPECVNLTGYSSWDITVEEMKERLWIQCLCRKLEDWRPEPDDEDFEKSAELCFVPGVSKSGADEFDVENLEPVRHGIESTLINNICEEDDPADQWAVPIHPGCFEIFKRMSMLRFGKVDIDGLWKLRTAHGSYENRFTDFPERPDVKLCTEQYHECVRGTEYLAANPIEPLGLQKLINECTGASDEVAFTSGPSVSEGKDPFAQLSFELRSAILLSLDKKDVANLRLASASFVRLPQSYFRHLVQTEMPWLWEVDSLPPGQPIDWHALWIQLSRADGGALLDEQYRKYRQDTIISYRKYDEWHAELERRGIERNDKKYMEVFWQWQDEAENQALEVVRKEKESGRWREKSGRELREIKGLRNRRVIWKDVGEVLRRIEGLESTEQGEGE